MEKSYKIISSEENKNAELEIAAQIESATLNRFRTKVISELQHETTLHGFRHGHIPENILVSKIGEMAILERSAEKALAENLPTILREQSAKIIGRPEITITKIAKDNPLEFKIKIPIMPKIELPDYKELAKKENKNKPDKIEVEEKEIDAAVVHVIKDRYKIKGDEKIPELTDAVAKEIGNFENAETFKKILREHISKDKERQSKEKNRLKISESILQPTNFPISANLMDEELHMMESQFKSDLEKMNLKFDDYLAKAKKTREDILKEWRPEAEKSVRLRLVLREIAQKENIKNSEEEIKKEVDHILEHHKDADPHRIESYVEEALRNEKVFQFLEGQK